MPNEECFTVIILFVRFHIELNREIDRIYRISVLDREKVNRNKKCGCRKDHITTVKTLVF